MRTRERQIRKRGKAAGNSFYKYKCRGNETHIALLWDWPDRNSKVKNGGRLYQCFYCKKTGWGGDWEAVKRFMPEGAYRVYRNGMGVSE